MCKVSIYKEKLTVRAWEAMQVANEIQRLFFVSKKTEKPFEFLIQFGQMKI